MSKKSIRLKLKTNLNPYHGPKKKTILNIYLNPNPVKTNNFYALFKLINITTFKTINLPTKKILILFLLIYLYIKYSSSTKLTNTIYKYLFPTLNLQTYI